MRLFYLFAIFIAIVSKGTSADSSIIINEVLDSNLEISKNNSGTSFIKSFSQNQYPRVISSLDPFLTQTVLPCIQSMLNNYLEKSEKQTVIQTIDTVVTDTKIPNHVAIIPDGNRRFAKNHKYALVEGLRKATLGTVPMITEQLWKSGVHTVSIWCFSTENWKRAASEVCDVMHVIAEGIELALLPLCHKMESRLVHLGRRDRLPSFVLQTLDFAIRQTKKYDKHEVSLCIDYGGQDEVCRMIEKLQTRGELCMPVCIEDCEHLLDSAILRYPSPDFIIRTAGEHRLSGYFLWQSAYSEFYFFEKQFPDLTKEDIRMALEAYACRQRRYGK